jgi:hypothetical protein
MPVKITAPVLLALAHGLIKPIGVSADLFKGVHHMNATIRFTHLRLTLAACAAALLTACVVAPAPVAAPYGYPGAPAGAVYAPVAPPAPYYEAQPALPFVGAIWIPGFWNWTGGRHVWQPGRYEQPRAGYRYQPYQWAPAQRGGWALRGGGWVR